MFSKRVAWILKLIFFVVALAVVCFVLHSQPNDIKVFQFSKLGNTVTDVHFVSTTTNIVITAPVGAQVYYTTDGSTPDKNATPYTDPFVLEPTSDDFPNCLLLKAVAYYADGTNSKVESHTFFAHTQIEACFSSLVFSVSGDPIQLTESPDGIFCDDNIWKTGDESEREIYVEAVSSGGKCIFEQNAGIRIYGGVSRASEIKSFKLIARKEYQPNYGKFSFDLFGTVGADNQAISTYDKLVVRNSANDLYNGYIRDELNQRLVAQAGYTDYQEVIPVSVYFNGAYYGFFWLHENYCDDFLKEKYGEGKGRFEILEAAEQSKRTDPTNSQNTAAAEEYNRIYGELSKNDLTLDENYAKVCDFMDVENYLQNYAYNIYVNNVDWPHNNNKCYRYYTADGESYGEGRLDGKWRFLYHDIDYTLGIYGQDKSSALYNNLQEIMTEGNRRYSPMFTQLMKREDCRNYFLSEIIRLKENVLSPENILNTLSQMDAERATDLNRWFVYRSENPQVSIEENPSYQIYINSLEQIRQFAIDREKCIESDLIKQFSLPQDFFDHS